MSNNFNLWVVVGPLLAVLSLVIGWCTIAYRRRRGVYCRLSTYTLKRLAAVFGVLCGAGFTYLVIRDSSLGIIEMCGRDREGALFGALCIIIAVFVASSLLSFGLVYLGECLHAWHYLGHRPNPGDVTYPGSWLQPRVNWVRRGFAPLRNAARTALDRATDAAIKKLDLFMYSAEELDDLDLMDDDLDAEDEAALHLVDPQQVKGEQSRCTVIDLRDVRKVVDVARSLEQLGPEAQALVEDGDVQVAYDRGQVAAKIRNRHRA